MIRQGLSRITRTSLPSRQRQLRLATIVVATLALLATVATPANAKPAQPANNDGWILLTARVCNGDSSTWKANRAANGGGAWVYMGTTYDIRCAGEAVTAQRPAQQTASRSAVRTSTGWVWTHPLANGQQAPRGQGLCPGDPRYVWKNGKKVWDHAHAGIDLTIGRGTPIYAVGGGQVIVSKYSGGAGNYVKIAHAGGYTSTYMHLLSPGVGVGTAVRPGQRIGSVGTTGASSGYHLHFEATGAGNTAQTARAFGLNLGC